MPLLAVINQKGGSGKSTIAVHLSRWLQRRKFQILLVDSDGQCTSSLWLKSLPQEIPFEVLQDPNILLDKLPELSTQYKWVVVDGPATLSETTRATALCCDLAVVPCQPTGVDLASASDTVRLIRQAQRVRGGKPKAVIFVNRAVKGTRLKDEAISVLREMPEVTVLDTVIHQRQIIADSFGQASTVFDMPGEPASTARKEYQKLFKEVVEAL